MRISSIEVIGTKTRVPVGERIELQIGNILRVNVTFDYQGTAGSVILRGEIGYHHYFPFEVFTPVCSGEASIPLTESAPQTASVDIEVTSLATIGTDYDLRVKFPDYPEVEEPIEDDIIDIVGAVPPDGEEEEEDEEEEKFPWIPVLIGGGLVAMLLATKQKN